MGLGIYTIILFNIERYLVISLSIGHTYRAKILVRKARFIIIIIALLESSLFAYFSKIINGTCSCSPQWFPLTQYILLLLYLISGGCYITGPLIFLPVLNILLALQINTIMKNSKNLKKHSNSTIRPNELRTIRLHLGQICIAVYVLICLLPNATHFITNEGEPIPNNCCTVNSTVYIIYSIVSVLLKRFYLFVL